MLFQEKPKDFQPNFEVVSCFCVFDGKFVTLQYQDHKDYAHYWGTPAGKMEKDELLVDAIVREVYEEIGLMLSPKDIKFFSSVYVQYPEYNFIYHMFSTKLPKETVITINEKEHKAYKWVTPDEALLMKLVPDEDICIKLFYNLPH